MSRVFSTLARQRATTNGVHREAQGQTTLASLSRVAGGALLRPAEDGAFHCQPSCNPLLENREKRGTPGHPINLLPTRKSNCVVLPAEISGYPPLEIKRRPVQGFAEVENPLIRKVRE
jgi:hypothetical protein